MTIISNITPLVVPDSKEYESKISIDFEKITGAEEEDIRLLVSNNVLKTSTNKILCCMTNKSSYNVEVIINKSDVSIKTVTQLPHPRMVRREPDVMAVFVKAKTDYCFIIN